MGIKHKTGTKLAHHFLLEKDALDEENHNVSKCGNSFSELGIFLRSQKS